MHAISHTTLAIALALSGLGQAAHAASTGAAIVGEATMVIGNARLWGEDGSTRPVNRGAPVRVGDRIETEAGGHVHLRFVDGARLSVRPASRLQIESYSHTPAQPQLGAIKFRLDEGVVRSITGAWGEAARERFRLNTPVAAIGVKGTDFLVRSDANSTAASVYTGAITVTPLTNGCTTSVGPCLNGNEKLLSEDMRGQMLALDRQHTVPTLVPAIEVLARNHGNRAPSASAATATAAADAPVIVAAATPDKPLALESTAHNEPGTTKNLVNEARAAAVVAAAPAEPAPRPPEPPTVQPPPPAPPPTVTPPVEPPVVVLPPQVTQLAVVRYNWTPKASTDTFTYQFEQAVAAGLERAGGTTNYVFFRQPSAPGAILAPQDASASFRLAESTAHLAVARTGKTETVNVHQGSLNVDFTRATFATLLALSSPTLGGDFVSASGTVASNGALKSTEGNASVGGVLSLDGRDAAYAFEKAHAAGTLRGVTLWGR